MALERLQALALFWVPQNDPVVTPAARENLAVERKVDREDMIAAIVSNVSLLVTSLRLSPGDRAEGVDGNSDAYNTRIPVSLHRAKERKARSPKQC